MTVVRRRRPRPATSFVNGTSAPDAYDVIELFAGPGGASMGLHALGLRGLGIEWDDSACATRRAAGLPTIQGDVSLLDPVTYLGIEGFWASPPCQGFSKAGLQKGHGDALQIMAHIAMCLEEECWVDFDEDEGWEDPRSHLVLEPLRWVFGMQPRWMVWEQVPFVQIIWDACKPVLEHLGYHVWTGKMYAEQYGVPQTRERAILIASLNGPVGRPKPTHSRYYSRTPTKLDPGVEKWVSMAEALGWHGHVGFPRRADSEDVVTLNGVDYRARDLRDAEQPSQTVTEKARSWSVIPRTIEIEGEVLRKEAMLTAGMGNTAQQVPRRPEDAPATTILGKGSAMWVLAPQDEWLVDAVVSTGANSATIGPGNRRDDTDWRQGTKPYERSIQVPAPTVDTKAPGSWVVHLPGGRIAALRNNTSEKAAVRGIDTPAPTMYFGARLNSMHWLVAPPEVTSGQAYELLLGMLTEQVALVAPGIELATSNHARKSDRSIPRTGDKPAPTLMFGKDASAWRWREKTPDGYDRVNDQTGTPWNEDWPFERPATVLATRDLVQHPGANANRFNGATKSRNDGLRVSVQEAGVLQSFAADYPWQGTRTKQFEAVGNAVPPLLASHAAMEAARPTRGTGWATERKKS